MSDRHHDAASLCKPNLCGLPRFQRHLNTSVYVERTKMIYTNLIMQWKKKNNLLFHQCHQKGGGVYRESRQGHGHNMMQG